MIGAGIDPGLRWSGEGVMRGVAAAVSALLHGALLAVLMWSGPTTQPLPPVADAERIQLLLLPPRAPEITPEDQVAPTPSVAAAVSMVEQPKPPPLPPSPPRAAANWAVPPPQPPQVVILAEAPPSSEASIAAAPPTPALPPGAQASTPGRDSWEGRVMATLEKHRRYPNASRARREQGTSIVRVSIARDGRVLALALERSSGVARLDDEALQTFRRAQPLPPVPEELSAPQELAVPVEFFL